MLGRLEMDVDECISAYSNLLRAIFETKSSRLPLNWKGSVKARFDSAKLGSAIKRVIVERGGSEADLFNDKTERGCRV